jgi:hypothetical protein
MECGAALADAAVDVTTARRPTHSPVTIDRAPDVTEERKVITVLFADVTGSRARRCGTG